MTVAKVAAKSPATQTQMSATAKPIMTKIPLMVLLAKTTCSENTKIKGSVLLLAGLHIETAVMVGPERILGGYHQKVLSATTMNGLTFFLKIGE